jgi:hypothetical protein
VLIDLGASFPAASLTNMYTFVIRCSSNGSQVFVRATNDITDVSVELTLTTDLPANTTFLSVRNYMNNGGTAAAVSYDCTGVYLETDY